MLLSRMDIFWLILMDIQKAVVRNGTEITYSLPRLKRVEALSPVFYKKQAKTQHDC